MRGSAKLVRVGVGIISVGAIAFGFQNCGSPGFELINQGEKLGFLSQVSIFNETNFGQKSGTADQAGEVGTTLPVEGEGGISFPVKNYCSTMNYSTQKRLVETSQAFLEVKNSSGAVVCDEQRNQFRSLIDTKSFRVSSSCIAKMTAGKTYMVRLYEPTQKTTSLGVAGAGDFSSSTAAASAQFTFNGENLTAPSTPFYVLYSRNPQLTPGASGEYPDDCDIKASPLVAIIGDGSSKIEMTSPADGINYDIQGASAKPAAHTKKRISWFLNKDHNYYFIALPNVNGQVNGIDDLFGDNTKGPDGKLAENGYAALAKFDSNGDHYITRDDAIFSRLRMWQDRNLDGISSADELFTLDQLGVSVIDLRFDKSFHEQDHFGNETRMKSVVRTRDGKLHLLFDLWFRVLD